jgi:hypothetical protein
MEFKYIIVEGKYLLFALLFVVSVLEIIVEIITSKNKIVIQIEKSTRLYQAKASNSNIDFLSNHLGLYIELRTTTKNEA